MGFVQPLEVGFCRKAIFPTVWQSVTHRICDTRVLDFAPKTLDPLVVDPISLAAQLSRHLGPIVERGSPKALLVRAWQPPRVAGEKTGASFQQLALPCANLVEVHFIFTGEFTGRLMTFSGFSHYLEFEFGAATDCFRLLTLAGVCCLAVPALLRDRCESYSHSRRRMMPISPGSSQSSSSAKTLSLYAVGKRRLNALEVAAGFATTVGFARDFHFNRSILRHFPLVFLPHF